MANYPSSLDTFLQHQDNVRETIAAAHANSIQDAVVAIQATLGTDPQGSAATVKDRLAAIEESVAGAIANQGYSPPVASTTTRGILKLAGDFSGTADAPRLTQLPNLATIAYADAPFKVKALGNVSGTVNLDLTQGNYFTCTATGNITFTVTGWNAKALYQHVRVRVAQDTTGGRTITWPTRFSSNSTVSGLSTAAGSYVLYEFASPDIGTSVSLWAQPAFSVPVQADRYDAAVLNLANLIYFWPTEETSGTTATDASGNSASGSYSGSFSFNSSTTVPTSSKGSPTFVSANSNYINRDSSRRAASNAAWSLGFTIKATDPGTISREVIYSETLSSDASTGQGFYIESGTTTIQAGKTAMNMRFTNASGGDIFNKVLSTYYFDNLPHHVVVSFDGGNAYSVYTDGVLTDSVVATATNVTVDRATWGARRRTTTDRYFSGGLGRLWLRSTATSTTDIQALYTAFGNGGGGSGSGGGSNGGGTVYDTNGVKLNVPTVTVNNSSITASAVIDRQNTVNFAYLQIAVRPPAGSGGTAFSTAYTPGTQTGSGTQTITGTGTCDAAGTWTAFATYSLVTNPVQADWVDGPPVSFTIGTVAPPNPDPGGGGGPVVPGTAVLMGMSGASAANGSDDSWIGKPIDIAGTWNDVDAANQVNVYNIQPGNEYGSWNRYLDLAVGGIFSGESWSQAASGAYDSRWRQCLTNIKNYWGSRDHSKLFIRFAHEFNGDWYNWKVSGANAGNFVTAWRRFRALQKEIIPLANLVWCPNDGTSGSLGLQLLDAFPGSSYVDVYAIDTYNQYPWEDGTSTSQFNEYMNKGLGTRNPIGPEAHRQAAAAYGLPLAFGEWSNCGDPGGEGGGGDAPTWMNKMMDWIYLNQGRTAGKVIYTVQFNLWTQFILHPTGLQPNTANAFKARMLSRS